MSAWLPDLGPAPARRWLAVAVLLAGLCPTIGRAGAQKEEALADSMRSALAHQIADRAPPVRHFTGDGERKEYQRWFEDMSRRLESRLPEERIRRDLLQTLDYEATRAGLDRQLVLGLIQVESNFRKYAISDAGARGLMQVMPFWTRLIGDGNTRRLFELRTNLRYGCVILRHYIDEEQGDLFRALGKYNGSVGQPAYPEAVRAAWQGDWAYRPLGALRP